MRLLWSCNRSISSCELHFGAIVQIIVCSPVWAWLFCSCRQSMVVENEMSAQMFVRAKDHMIGTLKRQQFPHQDNNTRRFFKAAIESINSNSFDNGVQVCTRIISIHVLKQTPHHREREVESYRPKPVLVSGHCSHRKRTSENVHIQ
jgi:hypothetical protein